VLFTAEAISVILLRTYKNRTVGSANGNLASHCEIAACKTYEKPSAV